MDGRQQTPAKSSKNSSEMEILKRNDIENFQVENKMVDFRPAPMLDTPILGFIFMLMTPN